MSARFRFLAKFFIRAGVRVLLLCSPFASAAQEDTGASLTLYLNKPTTRLTRGYYALYEGNTLLTTDFARQESYDSENKFSLYLESGMSDITFNFDPGRNIRELQLTAVNGDDPALKITDIRLEGFTGLTKLDVRLNSLTKPVIVPEGCEVIYGDQEPIDIVPEHGNSVNIGEYAGEGWSVIWEAANGLYEPFHVLTENDYSFDGESTYTFFENYDYAIGKFTHTSGLKLESNYFALTGKLQDLLTFHSDGSAMSGSISVTSEGNGTVIVVECNGHSNEISGSGTLNFYPAGGEGSYTVRTSKPDGIQALVLDNLGIDRFDFHSQVPNLSSISLRGNSLMPSKLPSLLRDISFCDLSNQHDFILALTDDPFTIDLQEEIVHGASVTWVDFAGNYLYADSYVEHSGIFTFVKDVGRIRAKMSSTVFPSFSAFSNFIDIDFTYIPFAQFGWSKDAADPAIFYIESKEDITLKLDYGDKVEKIEIKGNALTPVRLISQKGHVVISSTNNSSIIKLLFTDLGLENLTFVEDLENLENLDLSGNSFKPGSLPENIPPGCKVAWGEQGLIDLTLYLKGENKIDLYDFSDFEITWYYYPSGEVVPEAMYTDPTYYFTFQNVGEIYALFVHREYPDLIYKSTVVDFSVGLTSILRLECSGIPTGKISLKVEGNTRASLGENSAAIENAGVLDLSFPGTGSASTSPTIYDLSINNVDNLVELTLTGLNITGIMFLENLPSLRKIDLSGNELDFFTFPRRDNCEIILDNQKPVTLEIDYEKGIVSLPSYAGITTINLYSKEGYALSADIYEIDNSREILTFKSSVKDVVVMFSGHADFPGAVVQSTPITYIQTTALGAIHEYMPFEIIDCTVTLHEGNSGTIYNVSGSVIHRIESGSSVTVTKDIYVLRIDNGESYKISIGR